MYQIFCDEYPLFDQREEQFKLFNPRCKLKANTVGEGSFTILRNHPYFDKLQRLRSIVEIRQDGQPIFRGRMTADSGDFYNRTEVDLEGVLGFANDSIIPPFVFPDDFSGAANASNVVEYFFDWVLAQHNAQVEEWQQLKPGNVTVRDANNYISRSSEKYLSTWDVLKTKLFDSSLGGYLVIRYESDGNYVDYLESFEQTNAQKIVFDKNLLDITNATDYSETYSAIMPLGADVEGSDGKKKTLTLESLADGALDADLVKKGKFIYSKSAREKYGWICVPVSDSTWDDVTEVANLKTNGMEYLSKVGVQLANTITIKAVDLHFADSTVQSFRVYKNILVDSPPHGVVDKVYPLTELDIDIENPQNTLITIGDTTRTLIDVNEERKTATDKAIENVSNQVSGQNGVVSTLKQNTDSIILRVEDAEGSMAELWTALGSITLSASNQNGYSTLTLTGDGMEATSAKITFNGVVTFTDLEDELDTALEGYATEDGLSSGTTTINGGCITTGTIELSDKLTFANDYGKLTMASGSTGETGTIGAALTGPISDVYLIATDAGCRMQAGSNSVLVSKSDARITVGGRTFMVNSTGVHYNGNQICDANGLVASGLVAKFG